MPHSRDVERAGIGVEQRKIDFASTKIILRANILPKSSLMLRAQALSSDSNQSESSHETKVNSDWLSDPQLDL